MTTTKEQELTRLKKEFICKVDEKSIKQKIRILVKKGIKIIVNFENRRLVDVLLPNKLRRKDYWKREAESTFVLLKELNMLKKGAEK